jgi:NADH dehydrogenase
MPSLFMTGASGFIGRHLLHLLALREAPAVVALTRSPADLADRIPPLAGWRYVEGTLHTPATYRAALANCETVLHMAALTGKARPQQYREVDVRGTRILLEESTRSGLRHFLYVSSIAASFSDKRHYHYAASKSQGEQVVKNGSLDYAIIRPTMVLGDRSPVQQGLARLAGGPVALVPGGGEHLVQPVSVADLTMILYAMLVDPAQVRNNVVEVGGPDVLTMRELLERIRLHIRGRPGPAVTLPLRLLRTGLAFIEPAVLARLPLTAGQLAAFANDVTAQPHPLVAQFAPDMQSVDAMLAGV